MKLTRLLSALLLNLILIGSVWAATLPDAGQIKQEIKQVEANKDAPGQKEILEAYQGALNWLNERSESLTRSQQYRKSIDDFPKLTKSLRAQLESESTAPQPLQAGLTIAELEQLSIQTNSRLLELNRQLLQEQDRTREITNSLSQLPAQLAATRKTLNDLERRLPDQNQSSALAIAKLAQLQAEAAFNKAKVDELELEQLSASNRQEISRLQAEILKAQQTKTDTLLQLINAQLNQQRQQESRQTLEHTTQLAEQHGDLPLSVRKLLQENHNCRKCSAGRRRKWTKYPPSSAKLLAKSFRYAKRSPL